MQSVLCWQLLVMGLFRNVVDMPSDTLGENWFMMLGRWEGEEDLGRLERVGRIWLKHIACKKIFSSLLKELGPRFWISVYALEILLSHWLCAFRQNYSAYSISCKTKKKRNTCFRDFLTLPISWAGPVASCLTQIKCFTVITLSFHVNPLQAFKSFF